MAFESSTHSETTPPLYSKRAGSWGGVSSSFSATRPKNKSSGICGIVPPVTYSSVETIVIQCHDSACFCVGVQLCPRNPSVPALVRSEGHKLQPETVFQPCPGAQLRAGEVLRPAPIC